MQQPTFGWFVQLSARDGADQDTLFEGNQRYIERLQGSFDTLWFSDHLQYESNAVWESWTALTFFAARYPQFKVGSLALAQAFRNPALVAKMAATLQRLTDGRYIAGIGAGWKRDEHKAYGYPFLPPSQRLDQLEEAVQVMRELWSAPQATFMGNHHQIIEAYCDPKPHPPIPLLIAGGGEKVTLRLVAKHADWMNIPFVDVNTFARKLEVLKAHCDQVGRPFDEITKSVFCYVQVSDDPDLVKNHAGRPALVGTVDQIRREIRGFWEAGANHFVLRFLDFPHTQTLPSFIEGVVNTGF